MSLSDDLKRQIISSISTEGAASEENKSVNVVIGNKTNLSHVVNYSSGLPRIKSHIKFHLILSQPEALRGLSPLQIRCCLCSRIISYPAWYYNVRYAVNQFNYFVCFDRDSNDKPNTKCYKRG